MQITNGRKSYNLVKCHELICHFIRGYLVPLPPQNFQSCFFLIFASEWLKSPLPNPLKYSSHSKTKESDPGQPEYKNIWWGDLLGVDGGELNMPLLVGIGIFYLPKIGGDRSSSLYTFRRPCRSRVTHTAHTSQNRVNLRLEFEVS